MRHLAEEDQRWIPEETRPNEEPIRLAIERQTIETDAGSPRDRGQSHVAIATSHGARDFSVRRDDGGATVQRLGVDPLLSELVVELRAHPGSRRAARQPQPAQLTKAANPYAAAMRQSHLAIDQMDERQALLRKRGGDVSAMAAGGKDFAASEELESLAPVGLHVAEKRAPAGESSEEEFDREISIGGDERGRPRRLHWLLQRRLVAGSLPELRRKCAVPIHDFCGQEAPLAADAMPRKAPAQEPIDMLGMHTQQSSDVRGGEEGVGAVQVEGCEGRPRSFHRRGA